MSPFDFKLKFAEAKGKQKPTKFEGGPTDVLMIATAAGGAPEEAGVSAKAELTFAEPTQIKASASATDPRVARAGWHSQPAPPAARATSFLSWGEHRSPSAGSH